MQVDKETASQINIPSYLLSDIIDSSPIGLIAFKAIRDSLGQVIDFEYVSINRAASQIVNKNPAGMVGKSFKEDSPDIISGLFGIAIDVLKTGQTIYKEYFYVSDGKEKWVKYILSIWGDGFVLTLEDITDRKSEEEKFIENELLLHEITEASPEPIYIFDLIKGYPIYLNPSILSITGYSKEEVANFGVDIIPTLIHPDDYIKLRDHFTSYFTSVDQETREIDYRIKTKSGSWKYFISKETIFKRNNKGKPIQLLGIARDITEKREAEILNLSILNSSLHGIIAFKAVRDNSNAIVDFTWYLINKPALKFLGKSASSYVGKSLKSHTPEILKSSNFEEYIKVIETGNAFKSEKYYDFDHLDNWLEFEVVKLEDGVVVTFIDITERKRTEQILRIKNHQLTDVYKEVETTQKELKRVNKDLESRIKERNEELVLSEKRYRSLAVATSSIVFMIDGEGKMKVENKLWENYTGQWFDEYEDFGWLKVINPQDRKAQRSIWKDASSSKKTIDTEFRLRRFDNQYRHMQVRVVPILDEEENIVEWIGTCADIHDKKMAESALIESEERYELATKVTHDAVWDWNLITNSLSYTSNYFSIFGFEKFEPTIEEWYNKIHPDDVERVIKGIHRAVDNKEKYWFDEYQHKRGDGSYAYVYDRGIIMLDNAGKPIRIVGAMVDISKRKRAEEDLKKSEANLKEAQKISKLGNWSWDLLSNHISWSEEMYNIYEIDPLENEPSYKTIQKIHAGNNALSEKVSNAINYGTSFQIDTPIKVKSGEIKQVYTIGKAEINEAGKCTRLYGTSIDITERKKTEEKLEKAFKETQITNQKLIKMNEVLDNFVYAAAHDLRSPVANLRLILSLMENTDNLEKVKNHLKDFNSSINRLDNTIKGLVEVIEIQSTQDNVAKTIDFNEAFDNIIEELTSELEKRNGKVLSDFRNCSKMVYIEPYLLSILRNLISNSIKYCREGVPPEVRITTDREGDYVKIIIEDNGIGMDLERYGKNLFKPFTRFNKQVEGKGLGLHLIKNIIEKNDGKIKVASQPNKGSTFISYLKEY